MKKELLGMNDSGENQGDEIVDGPSAAAKILNRLPAAHREKLLSSMRKADPEIVSRIEGSVFTFDQLVELTDPSIQALIKHLEHSDLVYCMCNAKAEVKNSLMKNMSERKRNLVEEDLAALANPPQERINQARTRACAIIETLRKSGQARTGKETGIWV